MDDILVRLGVDPGERPGRIKIFTSLFVLLFVLLLHVVLFMTRVQWAPMSLTPPVEIHTIDPKKLETIRKQWKKKSLLLNQDRDLPSEKEASPDARYFSDRNRRVEKETRARDSTILPKPETRPERRDQRQSKPKTKPRSETPSSLSHLGIPFKLNRKIRPENSTEPALFAQQSSQNQSVLDPNLPMGSETILNTQESIYYSFYARLYEAIGPLWQRHIREVSFRRRVNPGEYSTVVDVILDRAGNILEVRRLQSSGIEEFDQAVERSWKKVGKFPHPPEGLLDGQNQVHTGWTFNVQIGDGFGAYSMPPEMNY